MSVITEGQRAGRWGHLQQRHLKDKRLSSEQWVASSGSPKAPEEDGEEEAGQPALLTDWLRLELGGCADLAQTLAVEGCQSHRVRRLRLQAHDGDDTLQAGCCENMERITNDKKPIGEMVQLLWETRWWVVKKLNTELSLDPAILLLGLHTEGLKQRPGQISTPPRSQHWSQ